MLSSSKFSPIDSYHFVSGLRDNLSGKMQSLSDISRDRIGDVALVMSGSPDLLPRFVAIGFELFAHPP